MAMNLSGTVVGQASCLPGGTAEFSNASELADAPPGRLEACPTTKVPDKFIAMSVDCNGVYVYLDPYEGGKAAVTEACRNLACSGAVPLGATDNLNMANPHKPELFWQMQESVRGLADGCREIGRAHV